MKVSDLTLNDFRKEINVAVKKVIKDEDLATKDDLKVLDSKIEKLATKVELKKLDKKFDKLFDFLDKDYIRVKQDVRDIQSHLHFPISDF